MGTPNTAARDQAANDFATAFATGVLTILSGATPLAVHNLAGFGASVGGLITANAIADDTVLDTLTADSATLVAGGLSYTLTIGTSGTEVVVNDLNYVTGGNSSITSLQVQF